MALYGFDTKTKQEAYARKKKAAGWKVLKFRSKLKHSSGKKKYVVEAINPAWGRK